MKTISFYGVEAQDMLLQHTAFWYIEYFKLKEFEEGHCDTPRPPKKRRNKRSMERFNYPFNLATTNLEQHHQVWLGVLFCFPATLRHPAIKNEKDGFLAFHTGL